MNNASIGVGLLGLGTIGSGVVKLLRENGSQIEQRLGKRVEIKKILERDPQKAVSLEIPSEMLADNIEDLLDDPEIQIIIELLGGIEPGRTYISDALLRGKHVVTANKDLIAAHGKDLFEAASKGKADLYFEASVGGGIPVLHALKENLTANKIEEVIGIVNGTTNYILTRMTDDQVEFSSVLKAAQEAGYAEADPTSDIEGYDAARKIAILASIAFNTRVTPQDVFVEGITKITPEDINYARELGYVIKLLAIAKDMNGEIEVRVHPAFLPMGHPLAAVQGVFNAVYIYGNAVGETMFYGQGAGQMPTASAVVGDVMEIIRNLESCIKIPLNSYNLCSIDQSLGKFAHGNISIWHKHNTLNSRPSGIGCSRSGCITSRGTHHCFTPVFYRFANSNSHTPVLKRTGGVLTLKL
jgi:homoserine dehydrogenase